MQSLWDVSEQPEHEIEGRRNDGQDSPLEIPYTKAIQGSLWDALRLAEPERARSAHRQRYLHERVEAGAIQTLSNADLISMLMIVDPEDEGIAAKIQELVAGYNLTELMQADIGELQEKLGRMKATQLKALLEMARRLTIPVEERYIIKTPLDAAALVMPDMTYLDHEELRLL